MGTWGTGIFSDDNAADLRDDYRDFIGDGLSSREATDRLLAEMGLVNFSRAGICRDILAGSRGDPMEMPGLYHPAPAPNQQLRRKPGQAGVAKHSASARDLHGP